MVQIIQAGGRLIRAARYIDSLGEAAADGFLDPADGNLLSSPGPERAVVDLGPLTILPGLVDCHVHLALPPPRLGEDAAKVMAQRLTGCLEYGLVAVRDGGDRRGATLDLKKEHDLPRLMSGGPALHPPGSYGSFLGAPAAPQQMLEEIAELAEKGADHVKLLLTGPVDLDGGAPPLLPQLTAEQLAHLVAAAHRRALKVMVHANGVVAVRLALACGVDSLEHGYGMDPDTLARLAASRVTWVPTLAPMAALARHGPPRRRAAAAGVLAAQMEAVSLAHALGADLGVGTDAGAPGVVHGESYVWELQLLREAGLPPAALIRAATRAGARLLSPWGARPEPPSPYVAVAGNPLSDTASLGRVQAVIV